MGKIRLQINILATIFILALFFPIVVVLYPKIVQPEVEVAVAVAVVEDPLIINGIDVVSGLIYDDGYELVKISCSGCHSLELVTQNSATREGWKDIIRWMQETQGLWDLGRDEPFILDYLAKNYAPKKFGRRPNLVNIEWYDL